MDNPKVDILLAAYNGGEYLEAQINSLLSQTYSNWSLILRDDASSDNTTSIIRRYARELPEKIMLIEDSDGRLGYAQNFARLMNYSENGYMMFCDQDDIWLDNKIELTLRRMLELEAATGKDMPLLIATDLYVTDGSLNLLSNSFWKYARLNPNHAFLNRLLVQNVLVGCTIMINKTLRDLVLPLPVAEITHDGYIGLVTSVFGKIECIRTPTVLYRRHDRNVTNIPEEWKTLILKKIRKLVTFSYDNRSYRALFIATQHQAEALLNVYAGRMDRRKENIIREWTTFREHCYVIRKWKQLRYNFFVNRFMDKLEMFIRL